MKKVLVSGSTGFVGDYVVKELLKRGHEIVATSAHLNNAIQKGWYPYVTYIPFNFAQYDENIDYFSLFGNPDILIHLAWEGLPNYKDQFHVEVNFPRHLAFLTNLIRNGLKDLTVSGTCLEYGKQEGCLIEELPSRPETSYAVSKNLLRLALEQLQPQFPFNFKWIRLFYMYGKGQNPNSLFSQLENAIKNGSTAFNMSGGEQKRDYLKVEEVAENITSIALQTKIKGIINCCSGIPITIKELVSQFIEEKHSSIKLNFGYYPYTDYEPMSFWGDKTKLNSIISSINSL